MEGYVGVIKSFGGSYAPANWKFCDGSPMPVNDYESLHAVIGNLYGGDGKTYFNLPDLRGRLILGTGVGPGLSPRKLTQKGGAEKVYLTIPQLPSHTHGITTNVTELDAIASADLKAEMLVNNAYSGQITPENNYLAVDNSFSGSYSKTEDGTSLNDNAINTNISGTADFMGSGGYVSLAKSGLSQGHENMPPFIVMNWIICCKGEMPIRP